MKIISKRLLSITVCLAAALLAALLIIPSITASAADKIYDYRDLEPATMKFKEGGSGSDCDFVSVAEAYGFCAYYMDMGYLLKDFDVDEYLKQNEKGYIFMVAEPESGFAARYSTVSSGLFSSWAYPNKIVTSSDDDDSFYYQTSYLLCEFGSGTEKQSYDYFCTLGNTKIFFESNFSSGYKPIKLTLKITSNKAVGDKVVYEKTIGIDLYKELTTIKNVDIYDFEFPGKHGAVMDTDAWSNIGNVVSIRYLDENKKTERTKLMAGDKGYVEFTVVMMQNAYVETPSQKIHYLMDRPKWDSSVKSNLKGSACSNIDTNSTSHVTTTENQYVCKFYHSYEIADNADYVITQGTIGLIAPKAGAKANKDVETSNVKKIVRRGPTGAVASYPQFTAGDATWLTMTGRDNKLTAVTSFSAGKTYFALVKLDPYGSYYFNDESVKNIKVPGASGFTITYQKAGTNAFTTEDGWYLFATFPKVEAKTFYLQIGYDKSEITTHKNDNVYLTATSSCDLTKAKDVSIKWYYYSDDIKEDRIGEIYNADLKLQLNTSFVGTRYYKCEISCTLDGKTAIVSYPETEWVKLTIQEKTSMSPLKLTPVGKQNIDITEAYQTVDFEVKASNANGEVRYKWYYCDASGKITEETPIGDGQAVIIHGITGKTGEKSYYKCVATDSKNTASLIFSCTVTYTSDVDGTTNTVETSVDDTKPPVVTTLPDGTDSTDTTLSTDTDDTNTATPSASGDLTTDNASTIEKPDNGINLWIILVIILIIIAAAIVIILCIKKKKKSN